MVALRAALTLLAACTGMGAATNGGQQNQGGAQANANPIRKVVTMLQNMQKKVTAEGEREKELFDKYMCYCKNSDSTLGKSISDAETKIPEVTTSIEEGSAKKVQLQDEVKSATAARAEAKATVAKATAIREKEASAFMKESTEYKSNIKALGSAISAISSGMSGGFLQTNTAALVRQMALTGPNMQDMDRQELLAFLSGRQGAGYVPKSGEITGILGTMKDEMSKTLADITSDETSAVTVFKEMVAAKKKEIESLTIAIEVKSKRVGELAVEIAMMKNDLEDTEAALLDDKKFLADLSTNCATKEKEWDEIQQMRSMELVALADTIKVLNDDDALEMFKKTLPSSASFLQFSRNAKSVKDKALAVIAKAAKANPLGAEFGFVELALHGKKIGFEKVINLIDSMVANLKKEQTDDDAKKDYCTAQLDETEDKKKTLDQTISDLETSIEDAKEGISTLKSELKALEDGIKSLDRDVAEATEQRKEEHEDHTELMASDTSAKQLLEFAKNRLNKFYNPKLYKAPPKRALLEEDRTTVSMGGTLAPTAALGGIAGTGTTLAEVSVHGQNTEAPPPPPEAPKAFKKKTEESAGVISMIDLLIKDLDKEMQQAEVEEKNAQKEYEKVMSESAAKRAEDSKLITEKLAMKAQLETELETSQEGKASSTKDLMATLEYMSSLHGECDWLLKNFQVRKDARASESDALVKAKAVLSGADFSFLQQSAGPKFLGRY